MLFNVRYYLERLGTRHPGITQTVTRAAFTLAFLLIRDTMLKGCLGTLLK